MGTGTSQGVPMIAHDAHGLDLKNPKNWRTRPSIHVDMGGCHIQVDAAQEFRVQCLREDIRRLDYFILTHSHADHILGMDDLRRFCTLREGDPLPVYANRQSLQRIRQIYPYAVDLEKVIHRYYPAFRLIEMPSVLELEAGRICSTTLPHGPIDVLGLVFIEGSSQRKLVYYTDCKKVGRAQRDLARGADAVILDALQHRRHHTHMSIEEAVETARDIGAPRTFFTHMAFPVDHESVERELPEGISLAYDGLRVRV